MNKRAHPELNASQTRYMRGDREPVAGSVPVSTSKYLNSPLFVHAFAQRSLRRYGHDVATTYDVPDMARGIADVADHAEAQAAIDLEKSTNPAFKAWIEERRMTTYDPAQIAGAAEGTLGAALYDFMVRSGLDIDFLNGETPPADEVEYVRARSAASHDIQHIVTGFDPDPAGEQALTMMNVACNAAAFNPALAQFISMPQIFVSAAAYSRTCLNYHAGLPMILEAMELGIRAGKAIKRPLVMVEWEKYLDWRLEAIAEDLGFVRGPGPAWHVSNETCLG